MIPPKDQSSSTNPPPQKLAFKISETAAMLGISESSVRRALERGEIKANRKFRHILIPMSEIKRFLAVD